MPKVRLIQNSMSSGEFAPEMMGHTDVDRYNSAIKRGLNVFSLATGGAKIREGLAFLGDEGEEFRLFPFIQDREVSFVIVAAEDRFRFLYPDGTYVMDGGNPYEIVTPYDIAELDLVRYAQSNDGMYIATGARQIHRLRRFADDNWTIEPAPFVTEPTTEIGFSSTVDLTLSSAATGTGVTFTAASAVFMASDVGRDITYQGGFATVTGYTSTTVVTCTIRSEFPGTSITGTWKMNASPQTTLTPSAYKPVGESANLTLSAAGWRSGDVGKVVRINDGAIQITSVTSDVLAVGEILIELSSAAAAQARGWSLDSSMWSADTGYPSCVCFHEQRLICSGVRDFPGYVFGSTIGNSLDFLLGTDDDNAFAFKIAAANSIVHVASVRHLVAMAYNGEFVIKGGVEKPITPTNIQVEHHSVFGSSVVIPVRIGNELFFVQRAGTKLRAYSYKYAEDVFDAPDMSKLASHRTKGGIVDISYQQEPYGRMFVVIEDGTISTVTIDRAEGVIAWTQLATDGDFLSVCTVPYLDKDVTFVAVKRSVDGNTVYYLEGFSSTSYVDSGLLITEVSPTSTFSGLDHLEGKTVSIIADGSPLTDEVVAGGEITIDRPATVVQIGLKFPVEIELLPIEFPTGVGSAQGAQIRTGEVTLRLLDSSGVTVNGNNVIPSRRFGVGILDQPADLFTGDKRVTVLGWERTGGDIVISHEIPGPFHLLAIIRVVSVND